MKKARFISYEEVREVLVRGAGVKTVNDSTAGVRWRLQVREKFVQDRVELNRGDAAEGYGVNFTRRTSYNEVLECLNLNCDLREEFLLRNVACRR